MSKTVSFVVERGWTRPPWFDSATPEMTGTALGMAAKLYPLATRECSSAEERAAAAREEGISAAVAVAASKISDDARTRAEEEATKARGEAEERLRRVYELTSELHLSKEKLALAEEAARNRAAKQESEALVEAYRERVADAVAGREEMKRRLDEVNGLLAQARAETGGLRTASSLGKVGEEDVLGLLERAGYRVVDTSKPPHRDKYLDLLVVAPDSSEEEAGDGTDLSSRAGLRVAIEVKNRSSVNKSQLDAFHEKVSEGLKNDLFDGAIFLSLRSWIPAQKTPVRVSVGKDRAGRELAPVVYLGAARTQPVVPLQEDVVEMQTHSVFDLLRNAKRATAKAVGEESSLSSQDADDIRKLFEQEARTCAEVFAEFARHQSLIDGLRKSLDALRVKTLLQHRRLGAVSKQVPWLQCRTDLPFERYYEHALRLASEKRLVWSNVSGRDSLESAVGKAAVTTALKQELEDASVEEGEGKRQRVE